MAKETRDLIVIDERTGRPINPNTVHISPKEALLAALNGAILGASWSVGPLVPRIILSAIAGGVGYDW